MVLAQRAEACVLLGKDNLCSCYAARPLDCRLFPVQLRDCRAYDRQERTRVQLQLLTLNGCEYGNDGNQNMQLLSQLDRQRWAELGHYQSQVMRWNAVQSSVGGWENG
jgi:hypothetical protein